MEIIEKLMATLLGLLIGFFIILVCSGIVNFIRGGSNHEAEYSYCDTGGEFRVCFKTKYDRNQFLNGTTYLTASNPDQYTSGSIYFNNPDYEPASAAGN